MRFNNNLSLQYPQQQQWLVERNHGEKKGRNMIITKFGPPLSSVVLFSLCFRNLTSFMHDQTRVTHAWVTHVMFSLLCRYLFYCTVWIYMLTNKVPLFLCHVCECHIHLQSHCMGSWFILEDTKEVMENLKVVKGLKCMQYKSIPAFVFFHVYPLPRWMLPRHIFGSMVSDTSPKLAQEDPKCVWAVPTCVWSLQDTSWMSKWASAEGKKEAGSPFGPTYLQLGPSDDLRSSGKVFD